MDLGAKLLELFLMGDAEVLLLVNDDEAEVLELHALAEKGMGADDDIDGPSAMPFLTRFSSALPTMREAWPTWTGKPRNRSANGLGVLAREERGRHDDGHLLAGHHRGEGRAQRHLGLAEADVAAHQPVHRTARRKIGQHRFDRRLLVLGLLERKARGEFVGRARRRDETCGASRNWRAAATLTSS